MLWYNGSEGSVFGLISFLRHSFTTSPQSSQILKIQPLRSRRGAPLLAVVGVLLSARAHAQKAWVRRDGVNEASQLLVCHKPLGTIDLVEEKTEQDPCLAALPPQFRAMMEMAQAQQGGGTAVDPLLQDRASGEKRVLVELNHRTHNASKDRDRDRVTAAGGYPAVRLSARARPTRASMAAAVAPTLA